MTLKAMSFDTQTPALLRPWGEIGERIIPMETRESDSDWGVTEDHFIAEPDEIEVLDFEDVKDKFRFTPAGNVRGGRQT